MRKRLNWETCLSKEVYCNFNVSQTGVWGRNPQQARRQGAEMRGRNKSWGVREVYLGEFEGGTGAREVYSSVDQTKKVKTKKKKVFSTTSSTNSGCRLKILAIFHEFSSEDQKKRSSFQKFYKIRCKSTKTTKKQFLLANSKAVNNCKI